MNIPTNIGTLALWLDGSDNSTITTSGANVTAWADKSGLGRNATYFGGTYPTKANPGIYFNSSRMSLSVPIQSATTLFMVASPSTTPECYYYGTDMPGAGPTFIKNYIGNSLEYFNGTDRFAFSTNPADPFLADFTRSTTLAGYYQGNLVYSNPSSNSATGNLVVIGAAQLGGVGAINATIYELIVYNSVLSEPDRKSIESYLQRKYARLFGITLIQSNIKGTQTNIKVLGQGNIK